MRARSELRVEACLQHKPLRREYRLLQNPIAARQVGTSVAVVHSNRPFRNCFVGHQHMTSRAETEF
jgi:hypothetical protein